MKALLQFAAVLLGLLAGGSLLIATGLVPYWRSLDPAEFAQVFSANLLPVGGTMAVLTVLGTGSVMTVAAISIWKKQPTRFWLAAAAAATLLMVATLPAYFGTANPLLAGGTLGADASTAELATWQQMHWFRTVMGILGFYCAVRAGYVSEKPTGFITPSGL
ncbi:DUF1772 domain-containing protein [Roseibium porphyridii]|uniref:DUF1772 domain-containing protein n=1 Tax=Roseibium porphyridii TaxID=2866279 RepID=A0ABY8F6I1_9HYPH|nr:DUF1772 domain-containing protein [Roseibium sp. KMA01]WFE91087.1 DUF1772 domain-containing protein [Roseibium sp. KMA01]